MSARLKMAGIDLRFALREIENLLPLRVEKAYQLSDSLFSLRLGRSVKRAELILWLGGAVYLSELEWEKPKVPPPLAMGLRKALKGSRIVEIQQRGLERIASFRYEGERSGWLHVELFGKGNLILTDEQGLILQLARSLTVRARTLRRGVKYVPPPSDSIPPEEVGEDLLLQEFETNSDTEVWRLLTFRLGIGPPYMEEIARQASVDLRAKLKDLRERWSELARATQALIDRLKLPPEPTLYLSRDGYVDFSAFPLRVLSERYVTKRFEGTFNQMLDAYLSEKIVESVRGEVTTDRARESIEKQLALRKEYEKEAKRLRAIANEIFARLGEVDLLLHRVRKGEQVEGVEVDRSRGVARIETSAGPVELELRLSAAENAARLYDRAKKLEQKAARIGEIIEDLQKRLAEPQPEYVVTIRKKKRKAWYERFRWFVSSGGMLVLAGLDASTNMELVKRYMEPRDLFFHVDMPGGAVVIVKTRGREVDEATIREAACYAASYSKAWREGLSQADVFYVRGDRVSTHAPSGTFLPRGSFYIEGRRSYLRGELRLVIGVVEHKEDYKVISRPPGVVNPIVTGFEIVPGDLPKDQAIRVLIESLRDAVRRRGVPARIEVEDLQRLLPSGGVRIVTPVG